MKIAFVSDSIYPYNKGGKETRSYELAKQLSKRHDVHFYTMKFWEGEDVIKKEGFTLHAISKNYPLYKNGIRNIKQAIKFGFSANKLRKEDFDVLDADHMVYFHLFPLKRICKIKNKPFIVTWHEVWGKDYWKKYLGWKGIFGYWIEKKASKLPDKIIAVSEDTKKKLITMLNVPKEKIIVIPNGVDIKEIDRSKPSKEKSDIIFAGRLLSHKNVDVLIKVMKQLKNKKLIIVGDGPEKTKLEELTKSLNLKNVIFKGFVENIDDVYSLMKSSKVFVLPSTREGFGITVIEANACGIPVITINHKDNASKDLIQENKNGYVTKLDENSLSEAINKALKKKTAWKTKQYVQKYDWSKIIKMFEGVYRG